ncbi:MAG: polysaccharide biosynthesis/export family protein [Granulosicoccus sp.]
MLGSIFSSLRLAAVFSLFVSFAVNAQSTESNSDYLLGPGDEIAIQVFDEPDLTMDAKIGSNGIISYSYLGDVKVDGKSAPELERHIADLLRNGYLVNPSVNITIREYRPFFISGEVRNPGRYSYQPGLTLDMAITLAGGLTDRASTRKMFVLRADETGSGKSEKAKMSTRIFAGDVVSIKEGFF